jgi:hypothetical protein
MQMAPWFTLATDRHARMLVERALYQTPGSKHFFVHVRIVNETASLLAVDLRPYFGVLYPNQWGASRTPRREVIDEARAVPQALDAASRAKLLVDFRAGVLTRISAHGSVDYYRDFNASSRADVEVQAQGHPYVIVAMDGKLDVTDGVDVERVLLGDDTSRELLLEVPVRWAQVPAGATVLADP